MAHGEHNLSPNEIRVRLVAGLLQAGGPVPASDLLAETRLPAADALPVLEGLVDEGQVVAGRLVPDAPGTLYCWAARWESALARDTARARRELRAAVEAAGPAPAGAPALESAPALAFHHWVINDYHPPADKRFLAILQCCVRRPFSSSPSHASMRRAISVATGCDPARDFARCPVHVVVMESKIGPVPYEFEDVYPATVGGGGVKHFDPASYAHARPILAGRMAAYLRAHCQSYDRIATFTEGRYAEVMADARDLAGVDVRILPAPDGPRVARLGRSVPRTYWQSYWIQLYLAIEEWLPPAERERARARLKSEECEVQSEE